MHLYACIPLSFVLSFVCSLICLSFTVIAAIQYAFATDS